MLKSLSLCNKVLSSSLFSVVFFFILNFTIARNLGHTTWAKLEQVQKQCYPFLPMFAVFSCVQTMVWLLHRRWYRWLLMGAVQTLQESLHWKLTLGQDPLLHLGSQAHISIYCACVHLMRVMSTFIAHNSMNLNAQCVWWGGGGGGGNRKSQLKK